MMATKYQRSRDYVEPVDVAKKLEVILLTRCSIRQTITRGAPRTTKRTGSDEHNRQTRQDRTPLGRRGLRPGMSLLRRVRPHDAAVDTRRADGARSPAEACGTRVQMRRLPGADLPAVRCKNLQPGQHRAQPELPRAGTAEGALSIFLPAQAHRDPVPRSALLLFEQQLQCLRLDVPARCREFIRGNGQQRKVAGLR